MAFPDGIGDLPDRIRACPDLILVLNQLTVVSGVLKFREIMSHKLRKRKFSSFLAPSNAATCSTKAIIFITFLHPGQDLEERFVD